MAHCSLCGNQLASGIDLNEIGNAPDLCLMNEPVPDHFGPHRPSKDQR